LGGKFIIKKGCPPLYKGKMWQGIGINGEKGEETGGEREREKERSPKRGRVGEGWVETDKDREISKGGGRRGVWCG